MGLGLGIFAVFPRFPGYQLRSFPVSAPIDVKGDFTGRNINNPGYVRQGNGEDDGNGTGQGRSGEPGKVDNNFYYGFNSEMNQNLRGEMKPKVVMRIRSQAEGFWRVLAFDRYTGKGWKISRNDDVITLRRSSWSYRISLDLPLITNPRKEVLQTYNLVSDLPNLIPPLSYPKEIYFPGPVIAVDQEGGLRSPLQLSEGITYTVVSEVPTRERTLLGKAGNKYPPDIKNYYLQIPLEIADKVRQKTEEILAGYHHERVSRTQ